LWKRLQSLRRWNFPVQAGTLHVHWSIGVVRKDPTITPLPVMYSESLLQLDSPIGPSVDLVSTDSSPAGAVGCAAAGFAGAVSCGTPSCGHWT
jgi:hypothetical protein